MRTRMSGGVGAGRSILPATRLGVIFMRLNTDAPDIGADEPAERIEFGSGQTRPQPSHQRAAVVTTVPKQLGKGLMQAMRPANRAQTECTIRRTKSELSYSLQHTNSQKCFMVSPNVRAEAGRAKSVQDARETEPRPWLEQAG